MRRTWQGPMLVVVYISLGWACCSCEEYEPGFPSTSRYEYRPTSELYNRYNLHYIAERGENTASFANWTQHLGHSVIPYNTALRAAVSGTGRRIYLSVVDTGMEIELEYNAGRMGMYAKEYLDLILSATPVSYEGLSDVDRQGIEAARAMLGMSKEAVKIALGYPARHRTPFLGANRWVYWKGRHDTYAIVFDQDGKVVTFVD